MRVLVVGPGVIGTVVAARLARAGHDVTVFGRGQRLRDVTKRGLRLWNGGHGETEHATVATTDSLPKAGHDLVIVAVRAHHWVELMPRVGALEAETVVTLINHGGPVAPWRDAVGPALVLGFPGISGAFEGDVVSYNLAPRILQPTTLGEAQGPASGRVRALCATLEAAGLPSRPEDQMEAWLRCHAGWMASIMAATLACHGEPDVLIRDAALRRDVVGSMREGLTALADAGVPLTPRGLAAWPRVPSSWLSAVLALAARRPELAGRIRDVGSVRGEADLVIAQLYALFAELDRPTPHWDALRKRL